LPSPFCPDDDDELLAPRDPGVHEVSLEKDVVLGQDRDHHGRVMANSPFIQIMHIFLKSSFDKNC
jgi:hypothetical protein